VHTLNADGTLSSAPQRDPAFYVSSVDIDKAGDDCLRLMDKYAQVRDLTAYEFVAGLPGMRFTLEPSGGNNGLGVFAVSDKKDNNYFDLVVYFVDTRPAGPPVFVQQCLSCTRTAERDRSAREQRTSPRREKLTPPPHVCAPDNKTAVDGLVHSGDVGSLLHTVCNLDQLKPGRVAVFAAVGYNRRRLSAFSEQVLAHTLAYLCPRSSARAAHGLAALRA
jgi:hypothetical protein